MVKKLLNSISRENIFSEFYIFIITVHTEREKYLWL